MKTKIVFASLFFCFIFNKINSQVFLINLSDSSFSINEITLKSSDKVCYVLNCLSKDYIEYGGISLKPLIVFKIFDYSGKKSNTSKPINSILLKVFLKERALPKLSADMWLKTDNLTTSNSDPNTLAFDSLIIYDGKSYFLINGGICIEEFFNVAPFKQFTLLQTNQSVFNIQSTIAPIFSWTNDSLPIPNIDEMLDGKMFLLKKHNDDYTFFRHRFGCTDCPLSFYNEYVYRKDYGIVGFTSKYLQYNNDFLSQKMFGKIIESDKYYRFR